MLFSGREDNLHRQGVGILMSRNATKALISWKPVNERIITARFYSKYVKTTVIQICAPTEDSTEEDKDDFYEQLQTVINAIPKHDIKLIIGDFNAKVGKDNMGCEEVMGKHGVGVRNDNGSRLVDFCDYNNLVITGTCFPHKEIHKLTWRSPDGQTLNQIDHIIVNRQHRSSVMDTRVMRNADISSDHYLVRTKLRLKRKKNTCPSNNRKKYHTEPLRNEAKRKTFSIALKNRFQPLEDIEDGDTNISTEVESKWHRFKTSYQIAPEETLGYRPKHCKPWISGESWQRIDERKELKHKINKTQV